MDFISEMKKINPIKISIEQFDTYKIPSNVQKSIYLYNEAVIHIKSNSIDLAIKSLKKSLSINDELSEAVKLLAMCYAYKKEFNKAEKLFKKLAKYDMYRESAKLYLDGVRKDKTILAAIDTIKNAKSKSNVLRNTIIISILVLIISGAALAYYRQYGNDNLFGKPKQAKAEVSTDVSEKNISNGKSKESHKTINEADDEVNKSKEEVKKVDKKVDGVNQQPKVVKKVNNSNEDKNKANLILNDADNFYLNGQYESSFDNLMKLKAINLDSQQKTRFDNLWSNVKSKGSWPIYNSGGKLYKQGKYKEALPKLLKAEQLAPDLEVMPWALYQIGSCYKEIKDNKNAAEYFNKVKEKYPNTQYANYSSSRLSEIASSD